LSAPNSLPFQPSAMMAATTANKANPYVSSISVSTPEQ
jgi:hypothetical protein